MKLIEYKFGQSILKNLLLYDDGPDFNDIVITQIAFAEASKYCKRWLSDFVPMIAHHVGTERPLSLNNISKFGLKYPRKYQFIGMQFFLRHAAIHQFVKDITEMREIEGKRDSLCSHAFRAAQEGDVRDFFKLLSAKLGDAAVEQVVLHEDDKGEIVFSRNYLTREMKVAAMYAHLPREKRYEIQQKLLAAFINNPDRNETQTIIRKKVPPTQWVNRYLEIDGRGVAINLPCGFNVLSFYFIEYFDESQLRQFVQIIVSVTEICFSEGTRPYSIWADYVDKACCTDTLTEFQTIDKFLKCVSEKLGRDVVVNELLYHNNGGGKVVYLQPKEMQLRIRIFKFIWF